MIALVSDRRSDALLGGEARSASAAPVSPDRPRQGSLMRERWIQPLRSPSGVFTFSQIPCSPTTCSRVPSGAVHTTAPDVDGAARMFVPDLPVVTASRTAGVGADARAGSGTAGTLGKVACGTADLAC